MKIHRKLLQPALCKNRNSLPKMNGTASLASMSSVISHQQVEIKMFSLTGDTQNVTIDVATSLASFIVDLTSCIWCIGMSI